MQRRDCNGALCEHSCLNNAHALCTRASAAADTSAPGASFTIVVVLCVHAHCIHETPHARQYDVLSLAVRSICAACAHQQVVSARHASCPVDPVVSGTRLLHCELVSFITSLPHTHKDCLSC